MPSILTRRAEALVVTASAAATLLVAVPARAVDGPVELSGTTYILTCSSYDYTSDWDAAAVAEFGTGAVAADFTDLQADSAGSFSTLFDWLGTATSAHVKVSGSTNYSLTRGYHMVGHTSLPGGFLVHAYISASGSGLDAGGTVSYPRVNVGSWTGVRRILVDVSSVSPIPTESCPSTPPTPTSTPVAEPAGPSWVPTPEGGEPSVPPGAAEWQDDDVVVVLEPTSEDDAPSFAGDGVTVVFTAGVTRQPDGRLLAAPDAVVEAEVCGSVATGGVIEVWSFSAPRLVAAAVAGDGPCHPVAIPVATPLDAEGPLSSPTTLQFAIPTATGVQAVNAGLVVGRPAPVVVRAGASLPSGTVSARTAPVVATTVAVALMMLAATRRREVPGE